MPGLRSGLPNPAASPTTVLLGAFDGNRSMSRGRSRHRTWSGSVGGSVACSLGDFTSTTVRRIRKRRPGTTRLANMCEEYEHDHDQDQENGDGYDGAKNIENMQSHDDDDDDDDDGMEKAVHRVEAAGRL